MDDVDSLDHLLRRGPAEPWSSRLRTVLVARWPWVAGAAAAVVLAAIVTTATAGSEPVELSLPQAGAAPSGGTSPVGVVATGADAATGSDAAAAAPSVTASLPAATSVVVHVAGAVNAPGVVTLEPGARVADAIAAGGGLRGDADADRINLAAPLTDGIRVYIPALGQVDAPVAVPVAADPAPPGIGSGGARGAPTAQAPVDINAATADELDALPGVGPSTAAAIIAYRTEHQRFASIDELQEVRGIGPAKFEAMAALVVAGS